MTTPDSPTPQHHWLIRWAATNPVLATLLAFTLLAYIPVLGAGTYAGYCVIHYLDQDREAQAARDYWDDQIDPLRAEGDRIEQRIYSQSATQADYARKRVILEALVGLDDAKDDAIAAHPQPAFPTNLCGLIPIGDE